MTLPIHPAWTALLAALPETGMGYQLVEVRAAGRSPVTGLVLNGEALAEEIGLPMVVRERPAPGEAGRLLEIFDNAPLEAQIRIAARAEYGKRDPGSAVTLAGPGPAEEATPEMSVRDERFLRYSAFRNDRRILSDGSVTPGTYATTWADGRAHIRTGSDAVRRYALPNPAPAVHEFELAPPASVVVRRGIVAPANGQPGGGVEIIFDAGCPAGTLAGRRQIPP